MVEGVAGSSPDWKGANMKTRGRAAPSDIPPPHLDAASGGIGAWGAGGAVQAGKATAAAPGTRRHYHASQLSQTTAWDCLPCVDAVSRPPGAAHRQQERDAPISSSSSARAQESSLSLTLANRQWRRHRREVPPPPCAPRPQGKRMLHHTAASTSHCKELLRDPQPPETSTSKAAAPTQRLGAPWQAGGGSCKGSCALVEQPAQPAAAGHLDCMQHSSGRTSASSSSPGIVHGGPAPGGAAAAAAAAPQAGSGGQKRDKKKAGRVEDDPSYFRTPKDPPTLQRFAASLAQLSLSKQGVSTTAQRHTAGIRARQQAQVVAAAREVAALADDVVGVGGHKQNG